MRNKTMSNKQYYDDLNERCRNSLDDTQIRVLKIVEVLAKQVDKLTELGNIQLRKTNDLEDVPDNQYDQVEIDISYGKLDVFSNAAKSLDTIIENLTKYE